MGTTINVMQKAQIVCATSTLLVVQPAPTPSLVLLKIRMVYPTRKRCEGCFPNMCDADRARLARSRLKLDTDPGSRRLDLIVLTKGIITSSGLDHK